MKRRDFLKLGAVVPLVGFSVIPEKKQPIRKSAQADFILLHPLETDPVYILWKESDSLTVEFGYYGEPIIVKFAFENANTAATSGYYEVQFKVSYEECERVLKKMGFITKSLMYPNHRPYCMRSKKDTIYVYGCDESNRGF